MTTGKEHHCIVAGWDQGHRREYTRVWQARCDPCKWTSAPTPHLWQAQRWHDDHVGLTPLPMPDYVRGPR